VETGEWLQVMEIELDQTGRRLTMLPLERPLQETLQLALLIQAQDLLDQALTTQLHPDLQATRLLLDHQDHLIQAREDLAPTQALQETLTNKLHMTHQEMAAMILTSVLLAILEVLTLAVALVRNQCRFARTRSALTTAAAWLATAILTSESLLLARRLFVLMSALFLDLLST